MDAKSAVAAIQAAKENIEQLAAAVAAASFLDAIPGADRQTLRAARAKLRQLGAEAAAKQAASNVGAGTEKSPHAKASYDIHEFDALKDSYEKLNWRMIQKPGGATVKPEPFYELYGLHMQAAFADNAAERPMWAERGGIDFEGRAKWDAWEAVKGTSADAAKLRFVQLYYEFPTAALYKDTRGASTTA